LIFNLKQSNNGNPIVGADNGGWELLRNNKVVDSSYAKSINRYNW